MALASLNVTNNQHFAKGGIKYIEIAPNADAGATNAVSDAGVATGIIAASGNVVVVDFEKESAKMTVSLSKTDGLNLYNISIEGYVPAISGATMEILHNYASSNGLRAKVYPYEGNPYLVGWDNVLAETPVFTDFPLILESMEIDSGSALQDQNGCTIKFSCVQGTPPAQY